MEADTIILKIETELDKLEADRNLDKITFWKEELNQIRALGALPTLIM
jgi:hypothetical protein